MKTVSQAPQGGVPRETWDSPYRSKPIFLKLPAEIAWLPDNDSDCTADKTCILYSCIGPSPLSAMFLRRQQQVMKSFVRRLMRGYRLFPEVRAAIMTHSRAVILSIILVTS